MLKDLQYRVGRPSLSFDLLSAQLVDTHREALKKVRFCIIIQVNEHICFNKRVTISQAWSVLLQQLTM